MINATTNINPFEIMTERSAVSLQKHDSEAPKFGSVLNNKLKDKNPRSLEAHADKLERVSNRPESKVKPNDETKVKPKDEPVNDEDNLQVKDDTKTDEAQTAANQEPKAEQTLEAKPQPQNQQTTNNSENADAAAAQALTQPATVVAQPTSEINPNAQSILASAEAISQNTLPASAEVEEQVVTPADTQTASTVMSAQVKTAVAAENIVNNNAATTPQATNAEQAAAPVAQPQAVSQMEAVIDTMGQNAATTANLPIADTKGTDKPDAKPADSSNTKTTFFGLTAKTADPNAASAASAQSEKDPGQNNGSENQTKHELPMMEGKRHERPFAQAASKETNGLAPAMPVNAEMVQPLDLSGNMTFSPQVIKAITGDTTSEIALPVSATTETEAASAVLSVSDTTSAAVVIPGRSSFDNAIRGLDSVQKTQAPTSSNTELQSKIIDQLVREVKLRQFQGQSDIMVKLNPAQLGQIHLQISQSAEGLTTKINASNEQVRGLLQAHIPALTNALADAGLRMDQVSVTSEASFNSLMQDNTSGTAYQQRNKSRQQNSGDGQNTNVNPAVINAANGLGAAGSASYSWLA